MLLLSKITTNGDSAVTGTHCQNDVIRTFFAECKKNILHLVRLIMAHISPIIHAILAFQATLNNPPQLAHHVGASEEDEPPHPDNNVDNDEEIEGIF